MFKGIISRDGGEPWGPTGMTSTKWYAVRPFTVRIGDLWATQPGVLLDALIGPPHEPHARDLLPHVVEWEGELYLEDGHHRVVRAALRGQLTILARVLVLPRVADHTEALQRTLL